MTTLPMTKAEYLKTPFGFDGARVNGWINWDGVAVNEPRVCFAALRASISWGYKDSFFPERWLSAKEKKIARAAYMVLYPGENYKRQCDNFLEAVGSDHGELPLVIDAELDHGYSPATIRANLLLCLEYLQEKDNGRKPVIYSRASWINYHTDDLGGWRAKYDWWLAHYGFLNASRWKFPTPPIGVPDERVIIHQNSCTGKYAWMQSASTDTDWWVQGYDHFYNYTQSETPEPEPETATIEERVESLESRVDAIEGKML